MAGLVLVCLPPLMGSFYLFSRTNKHFVREGLSASAAASVVSEEMFGSIRTVGSSGCQSGRSRVQSPGTSSQARRRLVQSLRSAYAAASLGAGSGLEQHMPCPSLAGAWSGQDPVCKRCWQVRSFAKEKAAGRLYKTAQGECLHCNSPSFSPDKVQSFLPIAPSPFIMIRPGQV